MIPQHPNWSNLTDIKNYPLPSFDKPDKLNVTVQNISLGPITLNNSQGVLLSRYWLVTQEDGLVIIRGSNT